MQCGVRRATCKVSALSHSYLPLVCAAIAAVGFRGKRGKTMSSPCLPGLLVSAQLSDSISLFNMKNFFKKAKKKAKEVLESLPPLSRQGRSPSPVSSHAARQSTQDIGATPAAVSSMPEPNPAQPAPSSPPPHVTPAYASPSPPPSALSAIGSVIYELLATIRDASDMCLPLKAATVGVLKIWDVCEVRSLAASVVHPIHSHLIAHCATEPGIHQTQR